MTKEKLTTMERRARRVFSNLTVGECRTFHVMWKKSSEYGLCPSVVYCGEKLSYASGCGYCKQSTVLAEALRFLFPVASEEYHAVWACGGAGDSALRLRLMQLGFALECTYEGKTEEQWKVTKMEDK